MQSQMNSHPQFPGSSTLIHHQLQQHQQSFPGIMENGIKDDGKDSSSRNFYDIRPNSKDQIQDVCDLKGETNDQTSDNETDVDSLDSLSQFSEQKKVKSLTNLQENDEDNEDDLKNEINNSPQQYQDQLHELKRGSKKRRRSSKTSSEENPQDGEKKRRDEEDEEDDDDVEKNGIMEHEESPRSREPSESPTQTEIKVQKPLGLLAQHGLSSGVGNKSSNSNNSAQRQQQFQQQLENQHRQQLMFQQQRQQHFNSLVSSARKGKFFDGDMNFNPFVAFPMKAEPERSAGDLYRDWSGYKENETKIKKSSPSNVSREDEDFEGVMEKDTRRRNGHDGMKDGMMMERSRSVDDSRQILLTDRRFMPSPPPNSSPTDKSETSGHHWTFEEQFKQLYEMSGDPKRREFLDDLFSFMQKRGTPVNRIPIMAKQTLDLYELFRLVISKGGLVEVINKKLWREITKGLNLPSSITSAAFTLRTQYMKYLYPYECEKLKLSSLSELQSAIDGNRREGRRPGFDFGPFPPLMPGPGVPHLANLLGPMPMPGGPPGASVHGVRNGVLPGCDDRQPSASFLASSAIQQLHMGGHFRSIMAENDARMMHEAATRAMEEVAKRVEESARSALAQPPSLTSASVNSLKFEEASSTPHQLNQSSSSPSSQSIKRPGMFEDSSLASRFVGVPNLSHSNPHLGQLQGLPYHQSSRIKITNQSNGRSDGEGSMSVSMEINGTLYHGVLFPSLH